MYVNGLDPRFKGESEEVRSFYSFTKVTKADEFDDAETKQSRKYINQAAFYKTDSKQALYRLTFHCQYFQ